MIKGVNKETFKNLVLNEGAFLNSAYNGTNILPNQVIGATRGGGTISIASVMRTRQIDGIPTNTAEARANDSFTASASFTTLEIKPELLRRAGASADYDETTKKITFRHEIKTSDFGDIYWVGSISDGRLIQIKFSSAINTNGIQLRVQPNNEGELSMVFEANYSVEDLDTPPVEITYLDEAEEEVEETVGE